MAFARLKGGHSFFMQNRNLLQIDEQGRMAHPHRLMSLKNFILGFSATIGLTAASAAEIPNGPITLEQCIQLAIENNLNLRITNYQPRLAAIGLQSTYSAYDPNFNIGISDGNRINKARQNPLQFEIPTSTTDSFGHNYGLSGMLPTNTRYNLSLSGNESTGFSGAAFGSYGSNARITLTQPLLKGAWSGDRTRMNIRMQKLQIKNSSFSVIRQITQTVSSVELAYYALIASRENVKVAEETLALTEKNFSNQKRR
ncbi:uncharacterized protein METZ01_LOCUS242532, partial [marine metagenome]